MEQIKLVREYGFPIAILLILPDADDVSNLNKLSEKKEANARKSDHQPMPLFID